MARTTRQISKSGYYHVLLRGEDALFRNEADKEHFLILLKEYFSEVRGTLLEEKKIHLILHSDRLSEEMKPLCTAYARYYNRCYEQEGKLFYDRFRSEPLESEEEIGAVLSYLNRFSEERQSEVRRLAMDDYEHMSEQELAEVVFWYCGIRPAQSCNAEEEAVVLQKLRESGRIRSGLVRPLFGERSKPQAKKKRSAPKKKTEDLPKQELPNEREEKTEAETPKPKKKELSVWLL